MRCRQPRLQRIGAPQHEEKQNREWNRQKHDEDQAIERLAQQSDMTGRCDPNAQAAKAAGADPQ